VSFKHQFEQGNVSSLNDKKNEKKKRVNTYLALPLLESSTTLNGRFLCGRLSIWKVVKERENNWFLDTTKKNDLN